MEPVQNKKHVKQKHGAKAEKQKLKEKVKVARRDDEGATTASVKANPKEKGHINSRAFTASKIGKTKKTQQRNLDRGHQKEHVPLTDRRQKEAPPPACIVVMGPPRSGKTTLIRSIVKKYTNQNLGGKAGGTGVEISGRAITILCNKTARLTIIECPNDMCAMMDLAKVADLVLMVVDASFGFEMDTFEFMNVLQVAGFPKVLFFFCFRPSICSPPSSCIVALAPNVVTPSHTPLWAFHVRAGNGSADTPGRVQGWKGAA